MKLNEVFCSPVITTAATGVHSVPAVLQVFPNPAQQTLFVKLDNERFDVSVNDMTGRVVYSAGNNFNTAGINCAVLSPGLYYVRVVNDKQQVFYKKVVITGTTD